MSDLTNLLDELDFEDWLCTESVTHKLTRGTNGVQANIKTCPVCGNSKWKTYFGLETGLGNCFVCDTKFSKWSFIKAFLELTNAQKFEYVKRFTGQAVTTSKSWTPRKEKAKLVFPKAVHIPIKGKNLKYLESRGVTSEMASEFGLLYCHEGSFEYLDINGDKQSQDYSRRIIIPILDTDGKPISFQGRDITGTASKRYLFPPEFSATGNIIYNANKLKGKTKIVLGEGIFDCLAIFKSVNLCTDRFPNYGVGATFGKSLGPGQLDVLRGLKATGLQEVIFCWDGERKALLSAIDAAKKVRGIGLESSVCLLPQDKDPNEIPSLELANCLSSARVINSMSAIQLALEVQKNFAAT